MDTNVLISGIFFGGPPRAVLDAWAAGRFELTHSPLMVYPNALPVADGWVGGRRRRPAPEAQCYVASVTLLGFSHGRKPVTSRTLPSAPVDRTANHP